MDAPPSGSSPRTWYTLEQRQVFSRSLLWKLQRQYFLTRSIGAWQQEEVPQYVTTNPTVANAYAEIVLAFLRDDDRLASGNGSGDEPLYLCELGAGSGRFAFHFLSRLTAICALHDVPLARFRYVLTDIVESNLAFYRQHPRFVPYFDSGILDTALFDVESSETITLQHAGATIAAGALHRPIVVLANYLFDSVPQDLFHFHDGSCDRGVVSLAIDEDPRTLAIGELLSRVEYQLDYEPLGGPAYDEPELQVILAEYQRTLSDTYASFPAAGLRCVRRLKALSKRGLLLLSADKGYDRIAAAPATPQPGFVRHGSFSIDVNYDAIARFCERQHGVALLPASRHHHVSMTAFLMADDANAHVETRRAYRRHVEAFGPDDFYTLSRYLRKNIADMSFAELLTCLRVSHYDSTQFGRYLPRLIELVPSLNAEERNAVIDAVDKVWTLYYPLADSIDLAFEIGRLLYELDDFEGAIRFFQRSMETYGEHDGALGNMAICRRIIEDVKTVVRVP